MSETEDHSQEIKPVPEISEVATLATVEIDDFSEEVPRLDEQQRNENEGVAEEGSVEEEKEHPYDEEHALDEEEPS